MNDGRTNARARTNAHVLVLGGVAAIIAESAAQVGLAFGPFGKSTKLIRAMVFRGGTTIAAARERMVHFIGAPTRTQSLIETLLWPINSRLKFSEAMRV